MAILHRGAIMRQSILQMEKHEIFDLVEALYTYAVLNHSGMRSELYSIQSDISSYFSPGMGWSESQVEEENIYYGEITDDNTQGIWNRAKYYLDNCWDD
jgi:hypothetical protein